MRNVGCVRMLWCVTDIHGIFMAGVVCGNLDRPRFGRVVMTGITFGSIATYSCQIGYRLVGESTRTCQANRQWSGVAPVCKSERAKKDSWPINSCYEHSFRSLFILSNAHFILHCQIWWFCHCFWYKKYTYYRVLSCRETNINSHFLLITSCGLWPTWQPRRWQSGSERDHLWLYRFLQLSWRVQFSWPNQSCVPG